MKLHRQIANDLIGQEEIEMFKEQNHGKKGKLPAFQRYFSSILKQRKHNRSFGLTGYRPWQRFFYR